VSTTHYSPSNSAADTEAYVRGEDDQRGAAITCDVPGPAGSFAARARALTQNTKREVQCLHYRQSFSPQEFDPDDPADVQRANDLGYLLAKKMHPHADCLIVTHLDGRGHKVHNHILAINHDNETGHALSEYRTFYDRKTGKQRGVQSINDEHMLDHGLSAVARLQHSPKDWELRREDFAEGSLDREMGDRMTAALADPRAVDKAGLIEVIDLQNLQHDDGVPVPRMRLHTSIAKRGKRQGQETWTLYIEDKRDETGRAERRKRTSVLCADFTPEGAQAFFDYHQQQAAQKEHDDAQWARTIEAARRAADAALDVCTDGSPDLAADSSRGTERLSDGDGRAAGETRLPARNHGADDRDADRNLGAQTPVIDHAGIRDLAQRLLDGREHDPRVARDRTNPAVARRRDRRQADPGIRFRPDLSDDADRADDGPER
jgi:hypothetical protein